MALLVGECDIRLGYWKGQRKWGVNTLKSQPHQCHKIVTKNPSFIEGLSVSSLESTGIEPMQPN